MAKINMSEDDLRQSEVPDGIHPAVIEKCALEPQKNDPTANNVVWWFLIKGDDDKTLDGTRIFHRTPVAKGKGGFLLKMLEGLKVSLEDFDTDDFDNSMLPVYIETKTKISNGRKFINVEEIRRA